MFIGGITTPIALAISLAACGGGSGFGSKNSTSTSTSTTALTTTSTSNPSGIVASSISLSATSRRLDSSGDSPITLSVIAKDANNVILPDSKITFSVSNNANLFVENTTTQQGGIHTATLKPGSKENRTVTVTASSGNQTQSIDIDIVGTQLKLQGSESLAINKATDYTVQMQDSSDQPIVGEITIAPIAGVTITPASGTTDTNGEFTFSLLSTSGGEKQVTATGLGATVSKKVDISDNDFTITSTNKEINIGNTENITISWNKAGVPENGLVNLHTTRGSLNASSVTVVNGVASFSVSSPNAGSADITATVASTGLEAILTREFVATTPIYLNTQASPTIIKPNATSRIISRVRDAQDNPVKNIKVNYSVIDTINGKLKNSGKATTDSLGRAEVLYEAGDSTSGFEGVIINTSLEDFNTITDSVKLTVGGDALRIVLGTDEMIEERDVRYKKTFVVIVTDSAGNPVADKTVDFSIVAQTYKKGRMLLVDTSKPADGEGDEWAFAPTITCSAEDGNQNGQLDIGEDENSNNKLEPSQDATITSTGKTGPDGSLTVEVIYPQSRALWSTQLITAKTLVNGTEYVENTIFDMPMLVADIKNKDVAPPNAVSPYGVALTCDNQY